LAERFSSLGRWKAAEIVELEVMEMCTTVLGTEDPGTIRSMINLARIYRHIGKWTESEKLEKQVLDVRTRVLGEEHPDTIQSVANLA
ncbi:hypothetical protein BDQ17DRAFT_1200424, partial [Cyathus striatus]